MRVVIVGLGIQGAKRLEVAGADAVAVVDPVRPEASHRNIQEVPLGSYDAALVCTPDGAKIDVLSYLLSNGKHVLVEKPLVAASEGELLRLSEIALKGRLACYTAYNHRFEPNVARMRGLIDSGDLGEIYGVRLFYGNGTARNVRDSPWRDTGLGVVRDLGSHLLDLVRYWFGDLPTAFDLVAARRFENRSYDHAVIVSDGKPLIELEMSLLSWRNRFVCDVTAERGSAHIDSLCKWGPATFTQRVRLLPSGRPVETQVVVEQADPTWAMEYEHFKQICTAPEISIGNDIWINRILTGIESQALGREEGRPRA